MVSASLRVQLGSSEIRVFFFCGALLSQVGLPGDLLPSWCARCVLWSWLSPELSNISLAFQVEPGVQPLGPASEGHENFPPKNAITDQESSQQIRQLVSCDPGFG